MNKTATSIPNSAGLIASIEEMNTPQREHPSGYASRFRPHYAAADIPIVLNPMMPDILRQAELKGITDALCDMCLQPLVYLYGHT
jgi:hypothetical protein